MKNETKDAIYTVTMVGFAFITGWFLICIFH